MIVRNNIETPYKEYYIVDINGITNTPTVGVIDCGITYPSPNFIHPSAINHYIFDYVLDGEYYITINNKRHIAKKGDFCIIFPSDNKILHTNPEFPVKRIFFSAYGPLVGHLCEFYNITTPIFIKNIDVEDEIRQIIDLMDNETGDPKIYSRILFELMMKATDKYNESPAQNDMASQIYYFINNNISHIKSLDDVCNALNLSKSSVIHIYKNRYGISPYHAIINKRLSTAFDLIKYTDMSIDEIAQSVNFYSSSHFIQRFKAKYNITPTKLRQSRKYSDSKKK